jgi:hypothetical protein
METSKIEFDSRVRTIRSKNLRNFLNAYYHTYVTQAVENPLITKEASVYSQKRPPRVRPGLRVLQRYLQCSRATAQYYLRAIDITRTIFVQSAVEKSRKEKPLTRITKMEYRDLLADVGGPFELISTIMKHGLDASNLFRIRNLLTEVKVILANQSGVYTPEDTARIIEEFGSLLL